MQGPILHGRKSCGREERMGKRIDSKFLFFLPLCPLKVSRDLVYKTADIMVLMIHALIYLWYQTLMSCNVLGSY